MMFKDEYIAPKSRTPTHDYYDMSWYINLGWNTYKSQRKQYWKMTAEVVK